jgi:hypothetical protein
MARIAKKPSPSRDYIIPTYSTNFETIHFKRFTLPKNIENTCDKATSYFYKMDLFSCGESAYPYEMHSDVTEMSKGFVFKQNDSEL